MYYYNIFAEPEIGKVGYKVCKKWHGGRVFNGKTVKVNRNGKLSCKYDDGEEKIYTLSEMKQFDKEKCNMAVSTENVDSDYETDDEKASESNEEVEGEDNLTSQKV